MDIDSLRAFCTALPAVTEDVKWDNDLCFSVGGRMFCVASLEPPLNISFKVPDDMFEEISNQPGIIPAPYLARAKWIRVLSSNYFHKGEWESRIQESYNLVKAKLTKKLREELGISK